MKMYVVDFEKVLKNYSPYHDSLLKINGEREKFSNRIEEIKKEMEGIISTSKSLFLDEATQTKNANRFKELQAEGMKMESKFRKEVVELQNKELENNFAEITEIVQYWAKASEIDLVINKNQVIYTTEKLEATDSIIELLKEKNLYKEYIVEEFETEVLETE